MSKCVKCGNEILTGDIHWEMGLCNNCYNELYKDHKTHISLDKMWLELAIRFRDENEKLQSKITDLEAKLAESEKPKEIRFNGFVVDCNYDEARKVLQEDILKMQAENKKLKESEELSNYAKCVLENKKLEEYLELSEKCCIEYEQEIKQLKQQLAEKDEEIAILEKSLECACSDLQSSGNAYINAIEAVKGNDVILPVENAMQIEYEIALSELGIVKPDNMPETYQSKQSKDIFKKDKIDLLEKVKSNLGWFPAITEEDIKIFKKKQMEHFRKRLMSYYKHNEECINTLISEIKGE